jgi:hypothetical protein
MSEYAATLDTITKDAAPQAPDGTAGKDGVRASPVQGTPAVAAPYWLARSSPALVSAEDLSAPSDNCPGAGLKPLWAFVRPVLVAVELGIGKQDAQLGLCAVGVRVVLEDLSLLTIPREVRRESCDVDEFHRHHFSKSTFAISPMWTNHQ